MTRPTIPSQARCLKKVSSFADGTGKPPAGGTVALVGRSVERILASGTLAIWKKHTAPETDEPTFLVYFMTAQRRPAGTLTFDTLDGLRALLSDLGMVGAAQDDILERLRQSTMTLVRGVEMTEAFIARHGL